MKLLLAEDDPLIGASVERGLRLAGFTVDWVRDGKAAELALLDGVITSYSIHYTKLYEWGKLPTISICSVTAMTP